MSNDCPKEAYEQQQFCKWLDEHDILYFAIANQGARFLKNAPYIGIKPGVPDLFLCEPKEIDGKFCPGLFLEMKRKKGGKLSIAQKIWIEKLSRKTYRAEVAKGHEEAIEIVKDYMGWDDES